MANSNFVSIKELAYVLTFVVGAVTATYWVVTAKEDFEHQLEKLEDRTQELEQRMNAYHPWIYGEPR